jgi:hypothetical protein
LTAPTSKDYGTLSGIVRRVTYLGNQFDYIIDVGGHEIRVQEDSLEAFRQGVPEEGSRKTLRFVRAALYEADAGDPRFSKLNVTR